MAAETQLRIVVDSDQANRELDKLDRNLKDTEGQSRKTGRSLRELSKRFASFAASVTAVTAAFAVFVRNQIQAGDQILKTADKIGISTDALQEYRYAADLAGVSQQALDMGLQRFARRAAEAAKGTGVLAREFEQLGIDTEDSAGNLRSVEEVLLDYADAIAAATDPQEQLRLAFKAFDSEGAALVNLFREGSIGVEQMTSELRDMGGVIDRQSLEQMAKLNDQMTKFSALLQGRVNVFMSQFLTLLERWNVIEPSFNLDFRTVEEGEARIAGLDFAIQSMTNAINRNEEAMKGASLSERSKLLAENRKLTDQLARREEERAVVLAKLSTLEAGGITNAFVEEQERKAEASRVYTEQLTQQELAYNRVFSAELNQLSHLQDLKALYDANIISLEEFSLRMLELTGGIEQVNNEISALLDDEDLFGFKQASKDAVDFSAVMRDEVVRDVTRGIGQMSDELVDFALTGEQSFADMTKSILADITKMIVRMQVLNALGFGAGGSGGGIAGAIGGLFGLAQGGVIQKPVAFSGSGVQGTIAEAGPEAVLPLARTSGGDLGVQALMPPQRDTGATVAIQPVINIINNSNNAEAEATVSQDGKSIEIMIMDVVRGGIGAGVLDKSLKTNFGLSRQGR